MPVFLSNDWVEAQNKLFSGLSLDDDINAQIQFSVSGTPEGQVDFFWTFREGRLEACQPGLAPDPKVTITTTYGDSRAIQDGSLDPSVAFMQGRLKIGGDMSIVLRLLPMLSSPDYARARDELANSTEIGG